MKSKHAKFFCENCGAEVPENSKLCKKCGKFFTSVRCPNCGATGSPSQFSKGCWECGYAVKKDNENQNNLKKRKYFFNLKKIHISFSGKHLYDSSLPVWIYIFTGSIFAAVILGVLNCITNPLY